jgi:hypothetical protein
LPSGSTTLKRVSKIRKWKNLKVMKLYIVKYEKNNEEYKKVVLKLQNDLSGEEIFYSGFLRELDEEKPWGEKGQLQSYAELNRDRPSAKK